VSYWLKVEQEFLPSGNDVETPTGKLISGRLTVLEGQTVLSRRRLLILRLADGRHVEVFVTEALSAYSFRIDCPAPCGFLEE
jgi:hypothetical protein